MNEIYIVDGQKYDVNPERKNEFLKKFPNAVLFEEPGKTTPTLPGANVEETAAPDLTITESPSVDISLGSPQTGTVDSTIDLQSKDNRAGFLGSIALSPSKIPANLQKQQIGLRDMALLTIDKWINPELSRKERVAKLNEYFSTDDNPIAGYPGLGIIRTANTKPEAENVIKEIRDKQLKTESQSISESIKKGNVVDAAFLAADGLIQTLPSIAFSAYGTGGIIIHGALIAGEKFNDEYTNNPGASESAIMANALGTGMIQAGADYLFRGLMKTSGVIAKEGTAAQAKQFLSNSLSRVALKYLAVPAEGIVEVFQDVSEKGLDDLTLGRDWKKNINMYEVIDNFLLGSMMQGGVTVASYMSGANADQVAYAEGLLMPENVKPVLESYAEKYSDISNQISKEKNPEAQKILKNQLLDIEGKISTLRRKYRTSLYAMNDAELTEYAANKDRIEKIKSGVQNTTTQEGRKILFKEIDNLNKANAEILKDATTRKFEETTAQAKIDAEKLGVDFTVIETAQEFDEYIKSKGGDSNALYSGSDGAILPLPNNKQEIVINQEVALETQAVNVASHELLHAVLNQTLLNKGTSAENLANALAEELGKIDINKIADSDLANRLRNYAEDPEAVQYEEVLTLFSDALATGDIKFEEGLFTKIGDTTRRLFRGFGKKIKFNSGRDVFNFIKDFNNSVDKGIIKGAKEGFTGKLVDAKTIGKKIEGEVQKFSRSKESSNKVQEIYDKQGVAGAMDIINQFGPIVNKLVNKYRDVPGFEFDILKDEIQTGKRGILDMIMDYSSEKAKGAPLAAYINKFLPARMIEIANRNLDTEFTLDVTEAKGVTDTSTTETVIEEKEAAAAEEIKKVTLSEGLDVLRQVGPITLQETVNRSLEKAVALSVKKYNEQISKNRTVTPFIQSIKENLAKDLRKTVKTFINSYPGGYEKFLQDKRVLLLNNFTTTYLSKHPLFKKGIQKSSGGIKSVDSDGKTIFNANFISPTKIEKNKFDWIDKNGKKLKIDRDSAAGRGLTSGPEIMRRDPQIQNKITENEFIDYHFQDGPSRTRKKQNPEDAIAMQIASELGFEYLKQDVFSEGPLFKKFAEVAELLEIVIPETAAMEISKDIDRGIIKFSKNLRKGDINFITRASTESGIDINIAKNIFNNAVENGIESTEFKNYISSFEFSDNIEKIFLDRLIQEGIVQAVQDAKAKNNGIKYEKALEKFLGRIYRKEIKVKRVNYRKGDLEITVGGQKTLIELKLNKNAQFSSLSFSNLFNNNGFNKNFTLSKNTSIDNIIKEFINDNNKYFNDFWDAIKKAEKDTGLKIKITESGNIILPNKNFWENVRQNMPNKVFGTLNLESNSQIIYDLYKGSNVDLIQIGEYGMYKIGSNKYINNDYSDFNAIINNLIRPTRSGLGIYFRLFPNIKQLLVNEENSLDTLEGITKFGELAKENLETIKQSKSLSRDFNKLLEKSTGVDFAKRFEPVEARIMGRGKGKKFFIPYSADDFVGLLYATLSDGRVGDMQMDWYKENLLRPFSRGIQQYEAAKQKALREWAIIKKEAKKDVPGGLNKKNITGLTNQDAIRIYIWKTQQMEIPGAEKSFSLINKNLKIVKDNPELKAFAKRLMSLNPEGYPPPSNNWDSGDITTDIVSYINNVKRSEFLTEWKENVDEIFSDQNKLKLKALYGERYVDALDDMLYRMKTGVNRKSGASKIERQFMDWTNNSIGAIMFFNARSAVLQTLSSVNFINFSDNNPINAGIAFFNQKQYWDDFTTLFNSDFLKQRRSGLQTDVSADEIARAAKSSKNKARAALSAILKFGFTPTQIADSFAIASGGATFYRNRIKKYLKEGLEQSEAEAKAFTDFQEIAEETQQSARPDRISSQQAGSLGRLILAFGNTPMQYARLVKKASLDLINGRGDWKTNISKIAYYSVIQNIIFSSLQQGLFALLFDDEDDEETKSRLFRIGNSSIDTLLRGSGVYGAAAATVKNMIFKIIDELKSKRPDFTEVAIEATSISPPINSKLRKLQSAGKTFTYKQSKEKVYTEGFSLENPAFLAGGKVISAATNLPADRVVQKADNLYTAMKDETELWQSIALSLGWGKWELGMIEKQTKNSTKFKIKPIKKSFKAKKFKTK